VFFEYDACMTKFIKEMPAKITTPTIQHFSDSEESAWRSRVVQRMALAVFVAAIPGIIHNWLGRGYYTVLTLALEQVLVLIVLWLLRRGRLNWATNLLCLSCLGCLTLLMTSSGEGFHDVAMLGMPAVLVVAALLLDRRFFLVLTALAIAVVSAVGLAEIHGLMAATMLPRTTYWTLLDVLVILLVTATAVGLLAGALRDSLTRTREQVAALAKSEDRFRGLIELAVDPIFLMEGDGSISDVNQHACVMTGYSKEELLGKPLSLLFPAAELERAPFSFARLGQGMEETNTRSFCRKDGVTVPVEMKSGMMPDGSFQSIMRDISERIRLTEKLQRIQKIESIGLLAGGIAHDFNNLLTVMQGYTDLQLARTASSNPIHGYAEQIKSATDRAAGLTRQLLAFSRQQVMQARVVNLNSLLLDFQKLFRRLIGEDIEVRTVFDDQLGNVKVDPGQMEQVILNLVTNARDAMPEGGTLTLETSNITPDGLYLERHPYILPGPYVRLVISDTGTGMDAATRTRIFEPFFTTKELGKGTGLGLATAYGIVKQSQGFIEVYSEVGVGSTFEILLPRLGSDTNPLPLEKQLLPQRGTETILLVEDDEQLRSLAKTILESYGYTVLALDDPNEVETVCDQHSDHINLLLTDVILPKTNGRELARRVASRIPAIRVLYMSGFTTHAIVNKGLLESGIFFLQKPFTAVALATKVREVLDHPTSVQA